MALKNLGGKSGFQTWEVAVWIIDKLRNSSGTDVVAGIQVSGANVPPKWQWYVDYLYEVVDWQIQDVGFLPSAG